MKFFLLFFDKNLIFFEFYVLLHCFMSYYKTFLCTDSKTAFTFTKLNSAAYVKKIDYPLRQNQQRYEPQLHNFYFYNTVGRLFVGMCRL